jgi:hypothetical protein
VTSFGVNLGYIWKKAFFQGFTCFILTHMWKKEESRVRLGRAFGAVFTSTVLLATALISVLSFPPALAGGVGPPGGTIWADDTAYMTVATPTSLPHPDGAKFDVIYTFPGTSLASVSEVKPGDSDYNGGRWHVYEVTFLTISPTQFTNDQDILDAAASGQVLITATDVYFVCPLIKA